jgi:hypothetical protein
MARVDILLTITRGGAGAASSLESVESQSLRDWRLIACVAPGVEGIRDALDRLGERVTVIETRRASVAAMRNEALARVDGEYLSVLEEGDRLAPAGLSSLLAGAQGGTHGATCGSWRFVDASGDANGPPVDPPSETLGVGEADALLRVPAAAGLVSHDLLEGKRFGANLERWSHTDLWLRLCEDGVRWQVVPAVVASIERDGGEGGIGATGPDELRSVIERFFRRASAKGWEGEALDEAHEASSVRLALFRLATRAALGGSRAEASRAAEAFAPVADEKCLTPEVLAETAAAGLRASPVLRARIDGSSESAWAKPVHEWWSRCVTGKWIARQDTDRAVGLLADSLIDRAEVADQLLGAFGAPGRVWIAGTGRSARAVIDRALEGGWRVLVIPEQGVRAGRGLVAMPSRVMVASANEGIGSTDPLVIGSAEETEFFERYGARPNVARWNGAWRTVSQRARQRLRAAWPTRDS